MQDNFNSLELTYIKQVAIEHRKKYAQFFTPITIAKIMANWLLKNDNLQTILEPAFGLGVFTRMLLKKNPNLTIKGFEIDNLIFNQAKKEFSTIPNVDIILKDYIYTDWENKYDGIICNPPYFKFHDYDNKNALKELKQKLNYNLNGFTNLYTLFLLKSLYQLKPNGRCAYIVPSEFLNSDYGKLVKDYLLKTQTLRHIIIIDFEENVFEDALTTASIILCAKDNNIEPVQFSTIKTLADISTINEFISDYPNNKANNFTYKPQQLIPQLKWKTYYQKQHESEYNFLVPFSKYAKVVRGIATGANDYFTFNISKANKYSIKEDFLLPCICHSTDFKGNIFDDKKFQLLKTNDKKVYLFNAGNANDENVSSYLKQGEKDGINKKFLTSCRKPWFAIEKRDVAPIWVSVFSRSGLRFVRNYTNLTNLTTFHCVFPQKDLFSGISVDLLFAYLITPTAQLIFKDNSREYGNGLVKFEPNDLNKGKMLDIGLLPDEIKKEIEELYSNYVISEDEKYISLIDNIFQSFFLK